MFDSEASILGISLPTSNFKKVLERGIDCQLSNVGDTFVQETLPCAFAPCISEASDSDVDDQMVVEAMMTDLEDEMDILPELNLKPPHEFDPQNR